jgi:thioredoxin 1
VAEHEGLSFKERDAMTHLNEFKGAICAACDSPLDTHGYCTNDACGFACYHQDEPGGWLANEERGKARLSESRPPSLQQGMFRSRGSKPSPGCRRERNPSQRRNGMSSVIEITSAEFEEKVLRSPIPVMVDFYSVACHRCRLLAPTLAEVADELKGQVTVYAVDAQEYADLAQRLRITAVPTVSIFKKGNEVARLVGLHNRKRLLEAVEGTP